MTTNGIPDSLRRGAVRQSWPGAPAIAEAATAKRRGQAIVMLFSLLIAGFVMAIATVSCAPLQCASGYPDPHWCERRGGGGGGESGGGA